MITVATLRNLRSLKRNRGSQHHCAAPPLGYGGRSAGEALFILRPHQIFPFICCLDFSSKRRLEPLSLHEAVSCVCWGLEFIMEWLKDNREFIASERSAYDRMQALVPPPFSHHVTCAIPSPSVAAVISPPLICIQKPLRAPSQTQPPGYHWRRMEGLFVFDEEVV